MIVRRFNHIQDRYSFQELEASESGDLGRFYQIPGGESFPSVTTVTGFEKKDFFTEWRNIPGNAGKSERAVHRGNVIHTNIENYLNNEFPDFSHVTDIKYRCILNSMKPYLNKISDIRALEKPLLSYNMKLAGRVDCVASYKETPAIIDFKGSDKEKNEKWIENYFQQATAYAIMWEEMFGERIDKIVIIIGNEEGFCQVFEKNPLDYVGLLSKTIRKFYNVNNLKEKE